MKNKEQIEMKIKELNDIVKHSFPCDDCHFKALVKIQALKWVLKDNVKASVK